MFNGLMSFRSIDQSINSIRMISSFILMKFFAFSSTLPLLSFPKPTTNREMLKLTFNLKVDRAELGAILKEFDPNIEDEIPAADFLR